MNAMTMLAVGSRLRHDGETYQVIQLAGTSVLMRSARGREMQIELRALLSHPTTVSIVAEDGPDEAVGTALSNLTDKEAAEVRRRLGHIREVLTGYASGSPTTAIANEPRPQFDPSLPLMARYRAKATELGVGQRTIERWAKGYQELGPAGLLDGRGHRRPDPLGGVDLRWIEMCSLVLGEHVEASRPTRDVVLRRIQARLAEMYGEGTVELPGTKRAYRVLAELSRGTNAFTGATKAKRSIAKRPHGAYGRLRATRPGEYLLLDTTPLDVFAMEPVTLRWVRVELTVALDLFTRCVAGLRLSPLSTKAVDAALVLYEAIQPNSSALTSSGIFPYHGVPATIVVDPDRWAAEVSGPGLPALAPETLVLDHGKIYLSEHLLGVCARLGISIQPARPYTPTDKSPVERFFRTLSELLAALPGYKGSDVYSRGADVEAQTYFFLDELEAIVREWVGTIYHQRPHDGLVDEAVPGLHYSPVEMFERGVARAGRLQIPVRPNLVYDFLPVAWRTIQHYGVEIHGLRYNGSALTPYRDRASSYGGAHPGKWPVRYDPDDVSRIFFQDPADHTWRTLRWEHAQDVPLPFSADALAYARRLAAKRDRFPDDRRALAELLERWDAGLTHNPAERRMALRLSQQRAARLQHQAADPAEDEARGLATVRALFPEPAEPDLTGAAEQVLGDDDGENEVHAAGADEAGPGLVEVDEDQFYADAFGTIE